MGVKTNEYIEFNRFNSRDLGLYLVQRDAPTPDAKDIVMDIPLMQGVLDFSLIMGERTFTNREITYEFIAPWLNYGRRKQLERNIKQLIMMHGRSQLFDTHDIGYYWLGKCISIETIVFDCYPFMLTIYNYFDDVWDTFNFDTDVANFTKYEINGTRDILLVNVGSTAVSPKITTSAPIKITLNDEVYSFDTGASEDFVLELLPGENYLKVEGDAVVSFHYAHEVMG